MKALYIYNPHNNNELSLIDRAKQEMGVSIIAVTVEEIPELLKGFVRATPALIIVNDDLQGEHLLTEGVDGNLLITTMLYKRMEEEDLALHQQETHRLDNFVRSENMKAIDEYTLELIMEGLL